VYHFVHDNHRSLAYAFGPALLRPQEETMDSLMKVKTVNGVVQKLLEHKDHITVINCVVPSISTNAGQSIAYMQYLLVSTWKALVVRSSERLSHCACRPTGPTQCKLRNQTWVVTVTVAASAPLRPTSRHLRLPFRSELHRPVDPLQSGRGLHLDPLNLCSHHHHRVKVHISVSASLFFCSSCQCSWTDVWF